jgi:ABC-type uncharacterized transport system permease subunit
MGLLLVIVTGFQMDTVQWWALFPACLCCVLGAICLRCVMLSVNSLGFVMGKVTALKSIVYSSRDFARYPVDLLPTSFRSLMCTGFPVLLMSNWPTLLMEGRGQLSGVMMLSIALVVTCLWVWVCSRIWRRGIRHYEGQSL